MMLALIHQAAWLSKMKQYSNDLAITAQMQPLLDLAVTVQKHYDSQHLLHLLRVAANGI